jgi:sugar phosphate permease
VSEARRLGFAGFCATAVAFGPARNGYGLFLPEIREEFGLSTEVLGFIASGLYAGYLAALAAVGLLAARLGSRPPVTVGLLSTAFGTGLVAPSANAAMPAAGLVVQEDVKPRVVLLVLLAGVAQQVGGEAGAEKHAAHRTLQTQIRLWNVDTGGLLRRRCQKP